MSRGFALYHWAPSDRRKSIVRRGLEPGHVSSDLLWKPPLVCFADGPRTAWQLIGRYRPQVREWDLWWLDSNNLTGYEIIPDDDGDPREYRVYERVPKRHLWLVGTRINEHHIAVAATTTDEGAS